MWGEGRLVWSGVFDDVGCDTPIKSKWSNHFQVQIVMYISETVLPPMHFFSTHVMPRCRSWGAGNDSAGTLKPSHKHRHVKIDV